MKNLLIISILLLISTFNLIAQRDEVNRYLLMIAQGKSQLSKDVLLELLAKYPNDPGVKFLHATVIENAYLAMEIYKAIVKDFPTNEWADDAQWRIVQFYSIVGDTSQAKIELDLMRRNYPNSPFLSSANDVVKLAIAVAKSEIRQTIDYNKPIKNIPETTTKQDPNVKIMNKETSNDEQSIPVKPKESKTETETKKQDETNTDKAKPINTPINGQNKSQVDEPTFYGLQVGIYSDKETAEIEKNKFLAQRMRTSVVEKKVDNKTMYAVVIGHYSSIESAEAAKIIVGQQCKCEPIIYKK